MIATIKRWFTKSKPVATATKASAPHFPKPRRQGISHPAIEDVSTNMGRPHGTRSLAQIRYIVVHHTAGNDHETPGG
jgi:hypothetical protein